MGLLLTGGFPFPFLFILPIFRDRVPLVLVRGSVVLGTAVIIPAALRAAVSFPAVLGCAVGAPPLLGRLPRGVELLVIPCVPIPLGGGTACNISPFIAACPAGNSLFLLPLVVIWVALLVFLV